MSRLFIPVLPGLVLPLAEILQQASLRRAILALTLCFAGQGFVAHRVGPDAAKVGQTRSYWIKTLAPLLKESDVVACVDIGWVSAAHSGKVVDLAGVTDPWIAALSGGHTSKALPSTLLSQRGVTRLLLLIPKGHDAVTAWREGHFARNVESRLSRQTFTRDNFELVGEVGTGDFRYAILTKREVRE